MRVSDRALLLTAGSHPPVGRPTGAISRITRRRRGDQSRRLHRLRSCRELPVRLIVMHDLGINWDPTRSRSTAQPRAVAAISAAKRRKVRRVCDRTAPRSPAPRSSTRDPEQRRRRYPATTSATPFSERSNTLMTASPRLIPVIAGGVAAIAVLLFLRQLLGDNQPSSRVGMTLGLGAALTLSPSCSTRRAGHVCRCAARSGARVLQRARGADCCLRVAAAAHGFRLPRSGFGFAVDIQSVVVATRHRMVLAMARAEDPVARRSRSIPAHSGIRERAGTRAEGGCRAPIREQGVLRAADGTDSRGAAHVRRGADRPRARKPARAARCRRCPSHARPTAPWRSTLCDIQAMKHDVDLHHAQRVLRGWLFVHLPVAAARCSASWCCMRSSRVLDLPRG